MLHALLLLACKKDPDDTGPTYVPDVFCPGGPDCADASGALEAGVARLSIEPDCYEAWPDEDGDAEYGGDDTFLDCGCDRLCEGDPEWPGADEGEGDGEFQAIWLAGSQNGRATIGPRPAELGLDGE